MYTLHIVDPVFNTPPLRLTHRARNPQISEASVSFEIPMSAQEAATYIDNLSYRWLVVARAGIARRYRLQTPTMIRDGVRLDGISLIATLDDDEYSALWSASGVEGWTILNGDYASRWKDCDKFWSLDTNGRLFMGLQKNTSYPHLAGFGALAYILPPGGTRGCTVLQFDLEFVNFPANFVWQIMRDNRTFTGLGFQTFLAGPLTGTRSFCLSLSAACEVVIFEIYNNTGSAVLFIGETGSAYAKMTNVRLATSTTNLIATTVALAIAVGSQVVTPASMVRIYVGQRLIINSGATDSESVVVTAVTATTFTAVTAKSHLANATIRAIVVYDEEIVKDVLSQTLALNPSGGLLASTGYIQSSGVDRLQAGWTDARGSAILDELAKPVNCHFGVRDNRLVYEPSNAYQRAWKVRVADLELVRPLDELYNSVRASYTNDTNIDQRTAYTTDEASTIINGITRRQTIDAQTTNAAVAATVSATALADTKNRAVRSAMRILRVTDDYGAPAMPDEISVGDRITIVGLPAVLAGNDRLRTFTVGERSIDPSAGDVTIVPDKPIKQLDVLLAQLALQ